MASAEETRRLTTGTVHSSSTPSGSSLAPGNSPAGDEYRIEVSALATAVASAAAASALEPPTIRLHRYPSSPAEEDEARRLLASATPIASDDSASIASPSPSPPSMMPIALSQHPRRSSTHHHLQQPQVRRPKHTQIHRSATLPHGAASTAAAAAATANSVASAAVRPLEPHQSLLAQSSRDELLQLNTSLLQEVQSYDHLTRELSAELEVVLAHTEALQAELAQTHTSTEEAHVALEVLRTQHRTEAATRDELAQRHSMQTKAWQRRVTQLKRALRQAGLDPNAIIDGAKSTNAALVSNDHRIDVTSPGSSDPSAAPARRRRKKPNREARARTALPIHQNSSSLLHDTEQKYDVADDMSDSGKSVTSDSDDATPLSNDEQERKYHLASRSTSDLQLAQSIDGLAPAPLLPVVASPGATSSGDVSSHPHPYLHLGLLDSTQPVSGSDYLLLHEAHSVALNRIKSLESKLVDQQAQWLAYLDLVQTSFRAQLTTRRTEAATQTNMILNTPAEGTMEALADERLVYVTPNIWKAVEKAIKRRQGGPASERTATDSASRKKKKSRTHRHALHLNSDHTNLAASSDFEADEDIEAETALLLRTFDNPPHLALPRTIHPNNALSSFDVSSMASGPAPAPAPYPFVPTVHLPPHPTLDAHSSTSAHQLAARLATATAAALASPTRSPPNVATHSDQSVPTSSPQLQAFPSPSHRAVDASSSHSVVSPERVLSATLTSSVPAALRVGGSTARPRLVVHGFTSPNARANGKATGSSSGIGSPLQPPLSASSTSSIFFTDAPSTNMVPATPSLATSMSLAGLPSLAPPSASLSPRLTSPTHSPFASFGGDARSPKVTSPHSRAVPTPSTLAQPINQRRT